jgi:hypothetical protein
VTRSKIERNALITVVNYAVELDLRALSFLQKSQYSSLELLLIGVKQSLQSFMIIEGNWSILRLVKIKHLIRIV